MSLITDRYPLEETQQAMERALHNKSGSRKLWFTLTGCPKKSTRFCTPMCTGPFSIVVSSAVFFVFQPERHGQPASTWYNSC